MIFKADENNVRVLGRSLYKNDIRYLSYSCAAVEFEFIGTTVEAEIWTDWKPEGNEDWNNSIFQGYAAVVIDNNDELASRFLLKEGTHTYPIYSSPDGNAHTVTLRIMKMSEAAFGKMGIISITADGKIKPTLPKKHRIEFIGDSITCGYGIEGVVNQDVFKTSQENPWIAYAAHTARRLDSEFNLISWSGIGIISSWIPDDVNEPLDDFLMPPLYDYTDSGLENILGTTDDSKKELWDFSKYVPELIVINIGTNDCSYTREIPERTAAFKKEYKTFVSKVRRYNPDANILCIFGVMDARVKAAEEEAVAELAENDGKIFFMPLEIQLDSDGMGADFHPSLVTHNKMCDKLYNEIVSKKLLGE